MSGPVGTARVLDEGRGPRAMTGVMAIMTFLTVLAAALGLATAGTARLLDRQLAGRLTVQVIEGEPVRRDAAAARVLATLRTTPGVVRATPVSQAELARLLQPWLGSDAGSAALPVPALIDVDIADASDAAVARLTARVRSTSPMTRIDRHERWMSPVGGLMRTLTLVALALVAMLATATAAIVILAARGGLETHRVTIEVMHMLGSTNRQLARLFQRRIALDALLGGIVGAALALGITALVGTQMAAIGSELAGGAMLRPVDWAMLACLPLVFVVLAILAARITITRALGRMP